MTVAVAGGAGRAAAARGTGAGTRVVDGRMVERPSTTPTKSARSGSSSTRDVAGQVLGGLAQGSAIGRGMRGSGGAGPGSPARRLLVAEFAVCMVVLAFSPLSDKRREESPVAFMKRASAVMVLFFVLGLISAGGRGASRAAAGFGGLVTLGLLVSSRSVFTAVAARLEDDSDDQGDADDWWTDDPDGPAPGPGGSTDTLTPMWPAPDIGSDPGGFR